jgi:hypothetical protein
MWVVTQPMRNTALNNSVDPVATFAFFNDRVVAVAAKTAVYQNFRLG